MIPKVTTHRLTAYAVQCQLVLRNVSCTSRNLGAGASALLTDSDRLTTLIAGLSVLALGVYSAREGTRVAGRAFDR